MPTLETAQMHAGPEESIRYNVSRVSGAWAVLAGGFCEPIAFFSERAHAVEYAERLAGNRASATVTPE